MESPREIIQIVINEDRKTAMEINSPQRGRKFKIHEIVIGMGNNRKSIPYKMNLLENAECRAEVLENGKLRII